MGKTGDGYTYIPVNYFKKNWENYIFYNSEVNITDPNLYNFAKDEDEYLLPTFQGETSNYYRLDIHKPDWKKYSYGRKSLPYYYPNLKHFTNKHNKIHFRLCFEIKDELTYDKYTIVNIGGDHNDYDNRISPNKDRNLHSSVPKKSFLTGLRKINGEHKLVIGNYFHY